jgi:long-chain acyl-CoA synthetase
MLRNDLPFLECMLAAGSAGAYCVPINWHSTAEEVAYVLADSGARHLLIHADLLPRVRDVLPAQLTVLVAATPPELCAAWDVPAHLARVPAGCLDWEHWLAQAQPWSGRPRALHGSMFYTSGTTGRPKAVRREPVPAAERESYARLRAEWFGQRPGLRTAIVGPLYHSVQSTYAYSALQVGGSVLLEPRFDAARLLELIARERLTHLHLVPTMMRRLVQLPEALRARFDVSSLEFVIHGAAPCAPDVKRRLIEWWGPCVHEYYGTSETGLVSRSDSAEWLQRVGTVGRPWPGRTVRIYDEHGQVLPPLAEGLVYMSLGAVPNFTYHHADERRAQIERDGLVTTGDIGYLDADGYLFLCDRRQDVIIAGGAKIWPAEVEAVLGEHPAVGDCAVFGLPDDDLGQVPAAVVQPRPGQAPSVEELHAFLARRLARYKLPRLLEIAAELPRDESGKLFKRVLRERYAAGWPRPAQSR